MIIETIAEKIKYQRDKKNIKQEKLAEMLNVSTRSVSNWESGRTAVTAYTLEDIARILDVPILSLHTGKFDTGEDGMGLTLDKLLKEIDENKEKVLEAEANKSKQMANDIIKNKGKLLEETGSASFYLFDLQEYYFNNRRIIDDPENIPVFINELVEKGYIVSNYELDANRDLSSRSTSYVELFLRDEEELTSINNDLLEIAVNLQLLKKNKYENAYEKIGSARSEYLNTVDRQVNFGKYELTLQHEGEWEEIFNYNKPDELEVILNQSSDLTGFAPDKNFNTIDIKFKNEFIRYFENYEMPKFYVEELEKKGENYESQTIKFAASTREFFDRLDEVKSNYVGLYARDDSKGDMIYKTEDAKNALHQYLSALR